MIAQSLENRKNKIKKNKKIKTNQPTNKKKRQNGNQVLNQQIAKM